MDLYEKVMELSRRRGYLWPSFEIYGGTSGFITYGPLGSILKRKIEDKWRKWFIDMQPNFVEIESPIIMPEIVFVASGHKDHFTDPIVECTKCGRKFRADHLIEEKTGKIAEGLTLEDLGELIKENNIKCPECSGELSEPDVFNLMFKTTIGAYKGDIGYARPEAAQGMFVEFKRIFKIMREKLPLGIAQIGKTMRNEISPRKGVIRLREFTIMEVEVFLDPDEIDKCPYFSAVEDEEIELLTAKAQESGGNSIRITAREAVDQNLVLNEWIAYFMVISKKLITELGIPESKIRFREQLPNERAHYSKQTIDLQIYLDRFGWSEIAGHAYRTDWDLSRHYKFSGEDLRVFKKYDKPVKVKKTILKPKKAIIGREFREDAAKLFKMLENADATDIKKAFETQGFYQLGPYKITPEHVEICEIEETVTGKHFIPHVIEPSYGADRLVYAVLENAYKEKDGRVILSLNRELAPISVAVFPLVDRDGLTEKAREIQKTLSENGFKVEFDASGSIGRRYARVDEIGVPIAITVDYQTLEDDTVTLRDRDTWKQRRAKIIDLPRLISQFIKGEIKFEELGDPVD
ncbi:MAG: glycine--tRNA ligase [Candidatus Odinarchaeia archaeon]